MKASRVDSDGLATSGAGLRCRASQPAHAEQQERARHLHSHPRAGHALDLKYRNASGGLLQARRCQPDQLQESSSATNPDGFPLPSIHRRCRTLYSLAPRGGGGSLARGGTSGKAPLRPVDS